MRRFLIYLTACLLLPLLAGCPDDTGTGSDKDTNIEDTSGGGADVPSSDAADDASDTAEEPDTTDVPDTTADTTGSDTDDGGGSDATDTAGSDTSGGDTSGGDTSAGDISGGDTTGDTGNGDVADGGDTGLGTCGGIQGETCEKGQWCDYANNSCGVADQQGTCKTRPQACNELYDPVCGCDGKTYSNSCKAYAAGVDIKSKGSCTPSGCSPSNPTCSKSQYCDYPNNSCGENSSTGTCKSKPNGCPRIYDPVCGCDDMTYSNDCVAHSKGVDVAYDGKCQTSGQSCGGTTCTKQQYCDYSGTNCSGSGTCKAKPQVCPSIYDPVCGCDDMTYSNECKAASAGVAVQHKGKCMP